MNRMNAKGLIVTVIGVGVALGGLIYNSQRSLEAAIAANRVAIGDVQEDVADLRERMARLEGLFEGFTRREGDQ